MEEDEHYAWFSPVSFCCLRSISFFGVFLLGLNHIFVTGNVFLQRVYSKPLHEIAKINGDAEIYASHRVKSVLRAHQSKKVAGSLGRKRLKELFGGEGLNVTF